MKKGWLVPVFAFAACIAALAVAWAVMDPEAAIAFFDQDGRSPFELATLPFYAAIIPAVWMLRPFTGSRKRVFVLCLAVSIVAAMAIVKELDLHLAALHSLYPQFVGADGSLLPGLFKQNGSPLTGTPFKMRVLTNAAVPVGMKSFIVAYFALFFGVFAVGFAYLGWTWLKGVFTLKGSSWAWGCFGASGVMVQVADRLPSWLGHAYGLEKNGDGVTKAASLCTVMEEGGEMMIAIFAILTMILGYIEKKGMESK